MPRTVATAGARAREGFRAERIGPRDHPRGAAESCRSHVPTPLDAVRAAKVVY
jgi:hypothetical protein